MKMAYQKLTAQIILIIITLLLIITLPVKNLITIVITLVFTTALHKLYWEIRLQEHPKLKDWTTTLIKTIFWTTLFVLAFELARLKGILGILILSVIIAGWKIYQGRELFNAYTDWASDRAWGRTKESFNFEKVVDDGQGDSKGKFEENDGEGRTGESNEGVKESECVVSESEHSGESQEAVSEVHEHSDEVNPSRGKRKSRKPMLKLSKDI